MAPANKRSNFLQFVLIFAVVYLGSQFAMRQFFPGQFGGEAPAQVVTVKMASTKVSIGNTPEVIVENKLGASGATVMIASRCPQPPVEVVRVEQGTDGEKKTALTASGTLAGCDQIELTNAAPGETVKISLAPWKAQFFATPGTYEVRLPEGSVAASSGSVLSARFTMGEPGVFTKIFRTFITAPLLNALVFIASILPGHNLGLAIILLTLLVKLILFLPTQHALEGQKKMQMLQPKLDALKKKYPDDAKKVQEETMKLWAEHKINPFQSCLPTLIQFPILIGLFYVIRDGSHLEASTHLLYPMYKHIDWVFGTNFLGLDLLAHPIINWNLSLNFPGIDFSQPLLYVLPPLLVVMQFLQMKLAFAIQKRKTAKKESIIDVPAKDGKKEKEPLDPQKMQQMVMLYALPLMIGFFGFQFPAAVSLYWGISTLIGIGQQMIVNREHLRV